MLNDTRVLSFRIFPIKFPLCQIMVKLNDIRKFTIG